MTKAIKDKTKKKTMEKKIGLEKAKLVTKSNVEFKRFKNHLKTKEKIFSLYERNIKNYPLFRKYVKIEKIIGTTTPIAKVPIKSQLPVIKPNTDVIILITLVNILVNCSPNVATSSK